jgi:hypothetical protein
MRRLTFFLALLAVAASAQAQVQITGYLRTNTYSVRIDVVRWEFMVGVPIEQMPIGWGGDPQVEDTFEFPLLDEQPSSCIITCQILMPGQYPLDPIVFDTWYTLAPDSLVHPDTLPPEVLFHADRLGVEETTVKPVSALAASPNPAAGSVRFSLLRDSGRDLQVFGADGRRVRRLDVRDGVAVWDGRDETGRPVTGVCLCRAGSGAALRLVQLGR